MSSPQEITICGEKGRFEIEADGRGGAKALASANCFNSQGVRHGVYISSWELDKKWLLGLDAVDVDVEVSNLSCGSQPFKLEAFNIR